MFSVSPVIVLLLYAILFTLRDILMSRMRGFTQVLFFNILSDTLYSDERFSFERGITKSECTVERRGRSYGSENDMP